MDLNRTDPNDQPTAAAAAAGQPSGHRQSLLVTSGRRLTSLFRNNSQPPVADPSNPPEVNAQRKKEYETIRNLNEAMEAVVDNFEQTRNNIQQFTQTVDQTEKLLDLWSSILSQSEHTKRVLENRGWQGATRPSIPQSMPPPPPQPLAPSPQQAPFLPPAQPQQQSTSLPSAAGKQQPSIGQHRQQHPETSAGAPRRRLASRIPSRSNLRKQL